MAGAARKRTAERNRRVATRTAAAAAIAAAAHAAAVLIVGSDSVPGGLVLLCSVHVAHAVAVAYVARSAARARDTDLSTTGFAALAVDCVAASSVACVVVAASRSPRALLLFVLVPLLAAYHMYASVIRPVWNLLRGGLGAAFGSSQQAASTQKSTSSYAKPYFDEDDSGGNGGGTGARGGRRRR